MKRAFILPALGALFSAAIGFTVIRFLNIKYGNEEESTEYFLALVKYAFISSSFSSILVYIYDIVSFSFFQNIDQKNRKSISLLAMVASYATLLVIKKDWAEWMFLLISILIFEFWSAKMILRNKYFQQQIARNIPVVIVLLAILSNEGIDLKMALYFGILVASSLVIVISEEYGEARSMAESNRSVKVAVLMITLVLMLKYIPVIESRRLASISVLSVYMYASKLPNFLKSFLEQVLGLNLLKTKFLYAGRYSNYIPTAVFFFTCIFVLVFKKIAVSSATTLLGLNSNAELDSIELLMNMLILSLPFVAIGILLKNYAFTRSGKRPIIFSMMLEIILSVVLFVFLFDKFGIMSSILYQFSIWFVSAIIFSRFGRIGTQAQVMNICLMILYAYFIKENILPV